MRPPATGIPPEHDIADTEDVAVLVRRFYQAGIADPVLGPLFEQAGIDWGVHVPLLISFWRRELLSERDWAGNVVAAHGPVLDVAPFGDAELARWVELFGETVDEDFVGPVAELAKRRAAQVASGIAALARHQAGLTAAR